MICEICGAKENLVQHHDSYNPPSTRTLCVSCHRKVHGAKSYPHPPIRTEKIKDGTWRALVQLKLDNQKHSIDEAIQMLLESKKG